MTEHVRNIRLRPGMYIGATDSSGIAHLTGELIANSVDQFLAGKISEILVRLKGNTITVSDDGPGFGGEDLPAAGFSRVDQYLTQFHNTPTADGHAPHIHLTSSGCGLVVVNALSSRLVLRMKSRGTLQEAVYRRGVRHALSSLSGARAKEGTVITFTPDTRIFGANRARRVDVRRMVFHAAHLFPGLRFGLDEERFHAPGGLGDFVALFGSDFGRHFSTSVDAGACFVYATAAGYGRVTQWQSWANGMPTLEHGTHVDGFQNALRRIDWKPAFAAVHVVMRHPRFSAPTRDKLCVEEVRDAVQKALIPPLLAAQEAQKN